MTAIPDKEGTNEAKAFTMKSLEAAGAAEEAVSTDHAAGRMTGSNPI